MTSPFVPNYSPPITYEFALAPAHSALVSLALLTTDMDVQDDEEWVSITAAALSPEQAQRNRLVFGPFGAALTPARDYPDFPAYLAALEDTPPETLRARIPDDALALASEELRAEAATLLADPPALHALIVGHLRELWERLLAPLWSRRLSQLQGFQLFLQQRNFPTSSAGDMLRAILNRELPDWLAAQLGGVRQVVFVLQPHVRLFASRFGSADTIWVFARPSPENLSMRSAPIKRIELVRPFAALADETRLHILELLAQGDLPTQEIIAQLEQSQPNVSRHIKQLVSAGFVDEMRGEGANKRYRLVLRHPDGVFWKLRQLLTPENSTRLSDDPRATQPESLRRFLDLQGRVTTWPARREDRALVLHYLADKFATGREYTEKEINATINAWHTYHDHATLRRELFSNKLIDRTPNGARYWRVALDPVV